MLPRSTLSDSWPAWSVNVSTTNNKGETSCWASAALYQNGDCRTKFRLSVFMPHRSTLARGKGVRRECGYYLLVMVPCKHCQSLRHLHASLTRYLIGLRVITDITNSQDLSHMISCH